MFLAASLVFRAGRTYDNNMNMKITANALPATFTVLGIDPGLASTGYAVLCQPARGGVTCLGEGLITTSPEASLEQRLRVIYLALDKILRESGAQLMAVEDLYTDYRNPTAAVLMGHARGACLLAAAGQGVPVASYPPTRVKKSLTGNGRASKRQMKAMVRVFLQLVQEPGSEHVADAMAVGLCHFHQRQAEAIRR